jgi:hypothetical protein
VQQSPSILAAAVRSLRGGCRDARLDARITGVSADLALVEHRLLTRLGGLALVLSGIIIAVLQPHG